MSSGKATLTKSHLTFLDTPLPTVQKKKLGSWSRHCWCLGRHPLLSSFIFAQACTLPLHDSGSKSPLILTIVNLPPLSMIGLEKSMDPIAVSNTQRLAWGNSEKASLPRRRDTVHGKGSLFSDS